MTEKQLQELISIVVPVYNVEKYLNRCLKSICNQTYTNLEILLIDDGSTDSCPMLCDNWANRDSRITVIHQKNGGLSSARNTGITAAHGKYIGFVDSDDCIAIDMYEKLYQAIQASKANIAICGFKKVYDNGTPDKNLIPSPLVDKTFSRHEIISKLDMSTDEYAYYVVAWNKLYQKDLFQTIRFPVGKIHEDEFTAHLFFDRCKKITTISEDLYYYVIREDSIMTRKFSVSAYDGFEGVYQRYLYLINNGYIKVAITNIVCLKKLLCRYIFDDRTHLYKNTEKYWVRVLSRELLIHKRIYDAFSLLGSYLISYLPDSIFLNLKKIRNIFVNIQSSKKHYC